MDQQRLAQLIRTKYPGSYDDIPDDELERKILEKYPEYKDLVTPKSTFGSRLSESFSGLTDFAKKILQGSNLYSGAGQLAREELGQGLVQPFNELITRRPERNLLENTGENIARFATGILGADYNKLDEDIQSRNLGGVAGSLAIPGAMLFGPKLLSKGVNKLTPKGNLNIPEVVDTIPPEARMLNAPPEVRGLLPAIGETYQAPRFFSGKSGLADANMQYIIDTAEPAKLKFQDLLVNEGKVERGLPTLLSNEMGELVDIGPQLAAEIGGERLQHRGPLGKFESGFFDTKPNTIPSISKELPLVEQLFPEGGQVVNPPVNRGTNIFNPKVIEPEFSSLFREELPDETSLNRSRPEKSDYVPRVLNQAGNGVPGLSVTNLSSKIKSIGNTKSVTYRDLKGNPIATARLIQDSNGIWMVEDFAADKSKGLLYGKAVKAVGIKLQELKATTPAGSVTPDALNLIEKSKTKTTNKPNVSSELTPDDFKFLHAGVDPTEFFKMLRDKLGPRPRVPYTGRFASPELLNTPQGDIIKFLQNAKPLRAKQDILNTQTRNIRAKNAKSITTTGEAGANQMLGQFAGEFPKVGFEPIRQNFNEQQINGFFDQIRAAEPDVYKQATAIKGLKKILDENGSQIPQASEMRALAKVFGKEFTDSIVELHAGLPLPLLNVNTIIDAINVPKSAKSSIDFAALRQGALMVNRREFWNNLKPMLESFKSQKAADAYDFQMKSDPLYEMFDPHNERHIDIGLTEVSKMDTSLEHMLTRDEHAPSAIAHKLLPWTQWSERSFNTFLNRLRFDSMKSILTDAKKAGIELNRENVEKIARYVRNATGRGDLPGRFLKQNAHVLNTIFFSPKFVASRFHMLNPKNYLKYAGPKLLPDGTPNPEYAMNKLVRKQYLRSALAMVELAGVTYGLSTLLNDDVQISGSPFNTDLGKTRMGDTRLDPFAGLQQPVVRGAQFLSKKQTDINTGEDKEFKQEGRVTPLGRFVRSKFSPTTAFVYDLLQGKDYLGNKFQVDARTLDLFIPMVANDLYELAKDDPKLAATLAPFKLSGMGGQTFNQTSIGQDIFGRKQER